jgi:catechol 2,3-dioxygenase-like lactoylglutathione lyase family enzyme
MKKIIAIASLTFTLCASTVRVSGQTHTMARPHIVRIDHVSFYTTSPEEMKKLWTNLLGFNPSEPIESGGLVRYMIGSQWVGYSAAPDPKATDRMDHVAFATDNLAALCQYLVAQGINVPPVEGRADHSLSVSIADPEGHRVEFVEHTGRMTLEPALGAISQHMIHAGYLVYNRAAEDHFYKDILGFRLYWHGGMTDSETDWVAMQVPDGTDWIEYMLNQSVRPDLRTTGVMNHISLGVADIKKAQVALESRGWKPHGDEKAQMGKDGKWQLNVYDPDFIRVELMEFKPAEKPCCSEFTGPHPTD